MILRAEKTRNIKKRQQNFVPRFFSVRLLVFWGGGWEKTGGAKFFLEGFGLENGIMCFFLNILKVV